MKSLALMLSLSLLSGCAAVVVGAGAAASWVWVRGNLEATLPKPLPELAEATRKAFEDLDLVAVDTAVDGLAGELKARQADGTAVRVKLKALDFASTEVRVRVGTLGDQAASEQLMRYIERGLNLQ